MPAGDEGGRDRDLLRQLAEGRQSALAELYDRHSRSLFRHALALSRRPTDAEDLVHSVFVRIANLGADLLGVRSPAAYLHRLLHSMWIDSYRRSRVAGRIVAGSSAPESETPAHDAAIDLARALDGLRADQREALVLHVIEGFSFREIGRMTGVSLFTAAARYRLALAKVRRDLSPLESLR